jgi:hypothetical protein
VLFHPRATKDQVERGDLPPSELIVEVEQVLARTDKEALMMATRAIPDDYADKLDQVEIALRPF